MGLLDDAIREHLDLKRRRGADPTEIERAEHEALGPVRRGPEPAADHAAPVEPPLDAEAAVPSAPHEEWEPFDESVDHELEPALEDEEPPAYEAPERFEEPDHPAAARPFDAEAEPASPPHPADRAPAPDPEPSPATQPDEPAPAVPSHLEQETEEYDLEEEQEEGDDMLESTPEFLQDAPDHDRLWFEQRPPRDFDFDG
jgi:hypothetical protein